MNTRIVKLPTAQAVIEPRDLEPGRLYKFTYSTGTVVVGIVARMTPGPSRLSPGYFVPLHVKAAKGDSNTDECGRAWKLDKRFFAGEFVAFNDVLEIGND